MDLKAQDRRPFFWPMVVGTGLSPIIWPAMLPVNFKEPHPGFFLVEWLAYFCLLLLLAALLPAAGWALASRGPFAVLALGGALLLLYWPISCVPLGIGVLVVVWERFPWPDLAIAALLAGQMLLFPLWLWVVWRAATGKGG